MPRQIRGQISLDFLETEKPKEQKTIPAKRKQAVKKTNAKKASPLKNPLSPGKKCLTCWRLSGKRTL